MDDVDEMDEVDFGTTKRIYRALSFVVPAICLVFLCGYAFHYASEKAAAYRWPYMNDALRDMAEAQTILDGGYPEDPNLLGETLWYNPLLAGMLALGHKITGWPLYIVDTRIGPYVNLLVPICFFLFVAALFDAWVALAAVYFFVFHNTLGGFMWTHATYTPWLFATHTAEFVFYLSLMCYVKHRQTGKRGWLIAAGVFWGVTFIGHTAWFVLLGAILSMTTLYQLWPAYKERRLGFAIGNYALLAFVGFLASLPFTYSILWHYHFHVLNASPTWYLVETLRLSEIPERIKEWSTRYYALVGFGLVAMAVRAGKSRPKQVQATFSLNKAIVLTWFSIAVLLILYNYFSQYVFQHSGKRLPGFVPPHHYLVMLQAVNAVLFGYGAVSLSRVVWRGGRGFFAVLRQGVFPSFAFKNVLLAPFRLVYAAPLALAKFIWTALKDLRDPAPAFCGVASSENAVHGVLVILLVFNALGFNYPNAIEAGTQYLMNQDREKTYQWLLDNCPRQDVFLCEDDLALNVVGPAGRKVVCLPSFYFNVYVSWFERSGDRDQLLKAWKTADGKKFCELGAKYNVKYLLVEDEDARLLDNFHLPFLQEKFRAGALVVYEVVCGADTTAELSPDEMHRFQDAVLDEYRRKIAARPDFVVPYFEMDEIYMQRKDIDGRIAEWRAMIEKYPTVSRPYFHLAKALNEKGDLAAAIEQFRRARDLQPTDGGIQFELGQVLVANNEPAAAIPELRKALEMTPQNIGIRPKLVEALFNNGEVDAARAEALINKNGGQPLPQWLDEKLFPKS